MTVSARLSIHFFVGSSGNERSRGSEGAGVGAGGGSRVVLMCLRPRPMVMMPRGAGRCLAE